LPRKGNFKKSWRRGENQEKATTRKTRVAENCCRGTIAREWNRKTRKMKKHCRWQEKKKLCGQVNSFLKGKAGGCVMRRMGSPMCGKSREDHAASDKPGGDWKTRLSGRRFKRGKRSHPMRKNGTQRGK